MGGAQVPVLKGKAARIDREVSFQPMASGNMSAVSEYFHLKGFVGERGVLAHERL